LTLRGVWRKMCNATLIKCTYAILLF
jgi:hypothetical protein